MMPRATRPGAMRAERISMQRLQSADRRVGWLACALLQVPRALRRPRPASETPREVLLMKFWGIGSLQLLTPAVAALRRRHPGARLSLLTLEQNAAFARGLGAFDEVLTLDVSCRGWTQAFARILKLLLALRRRRFDRLYDFEFFTRFSAVVSFLARADATVGFSAPTVWRGRLHGEEVPFNRYWHVARNFRALAGGETGAEVAADELTPFPRGLEAEASLARRLAAAGLASGEPYVVLNPNAGQLSLERRWPAPRFAELARRLIDEEGCAVVLVGAASERAYVAGVAAEVGPARRGALIGLAGELSIEELAALLRRAAAVVSNDSGPMHVAAALGAPTLGLFGPETPTMYAPLGPRAESLWDPPVCSPCINVHDGKVANCIHGRPECLMNLSVERVHQRALALMERELPAVLLHPAARRAAPVAPRRDGARPDGSRECASSS